MSKCLKDSPFYDDSIKDPRMQFTIERSLDNPEKEYDLTMSGKTQVSTTTGTYRKAKAKYFPTLKGNDILDYGAGKGLASEELGFDSFEPNPTGWTPKYTDPKTITKKYKGIISNAVLNVLPRQVRDAVVLDIGEKLSPGGKAFINVRALKGDVDKAKNPTPFEDGLITSKGTFQKGFNKDELVNYLQETLGPGFTVAKSPLGTVGAVITKNKQSHKPSLHTEWDSVNDNLVLKDTPQSPGFFTYERSSPATKSLVDFALQHDTNFRINADGSLTLEIEAYKDGKPTGVKREKVRTMQELRRALGY